MRLLLQHGADLDPSDKDGFTPLHAAAASGAKQAVQLLLGEGSEAEAANSAGNTAAHIACLNGHDEVMAHLLAATSGFDVEPNGKGETLLHISAAAPASDLCLQVR